MSHRLYGVDYDGNVKTISVYVEGRSARLSGPNGRHLVHPSNQGSAEGWIREAKLVWGLKNVIDVYVKSLGSDADKLAQEEIQKQADEIKRAIADHAKAQAAL